ncbi:MAG: 3-keto-5-aminohexanoate cleavage enzyme [Parasphingorhabdus sp.]|jgi:3-keto-5-aminohexanoate cleavage enzyme
MSRPVIVMAAPNGARKTYEDHPALPATIAETARAARSCMENGASMLHAHVRDDQLRHVLDAGLYSQLFDAVRTEAPGMLLQMTTEAVGIYSVEQQIDCVQKVVPEYITMALKEMAPDDESLPRAKQFYHWAFENSVHIQHILFSAEEVSRFWTLHSSGIMPEENPCLLYVLGRYSKNFQSTAEDLNPFLDIEATQRHTWFVCAFGHSEFDCAMAAVNAGGHARIGFENNLYKKDGSLAKDNADNIAQLTLAIRQAGNIVATPEITKELLRN